MANDLEIANDCKSAFDKAKRLIAERKKRFNRIPEIQEFDNGNILIQYFEHWDIHWENNLKRRDFQSIQKDNKNIVTIYAEAGQTINVENPNTSKTYLIINGELSVIFEDSTQTISTFQSISVPQNLNHTIQAVRDTYVIIVSE